MTLLLPDLTPPSFRLPAVEAHYSPDQLRRYALHAFWGAPDAPRLTWLMLNPSIAGLALTQDNLDPTLRRVRQFSQDAGYTGFTVLNLFSLVSTDPRGLADESPEDLSAEEPVLPLLRAADRLVCAWGRHPMAAARARLMLRETAAALLCLKTNADGSPCHPLYLPRSLTLRPWGADAKT